PPHWRWLPRRGSPLTIEPFVFTERGRISEILKSHGIGGMQRSDRSLCIARRGEGRRTSECQCSAYSYPGAFFDGHFIQGFLSNARINSNSEKREELDTKAVPF